MLLLMFLSASGRRRLVAAIIALVVAFLSRGRLRRALADRRRPDHKTEETDESQVYERAKPVVKETPAKDNANIQRGEAQAETKMDEKRDGVVAAVTAETEVDEKKKQVGHETFPVRPDFVGQWVCSRIGTTFPDYLIDAGVKETARQVMKADGYGAGRKPWQYNIKQKGDLFEIEQVELARTVLKFRIGEGVQETRSLTNERIAVVDPHWVDDRILEMECTDLKKKKLSTRRQYFEGEEMVIDFITPNGVSGKRYHRRVVT